MTPLVSRFYPVVPAVGWIARLVPVGARVIQLRIKDVPEDEVRSQAAEAQMICQSHGAQFILNDYWRIAIDLGLPWLHLGQEDLETADLPAIRRAGICLGVSTHSDEELDRALEADPDYLALGPIYPTTLKVMPWAPQGLEQITKWKQRIGSRQLVAIGGITLDRMPLCRAAGADVVAVVSDILAHPAPELRSRSWIQGLDA